LFWCKKLYLILLCMFFNLRLIIKLWVNTWLRETRFNYLHVTATRVGRKQIRKVQKKLLSLSLPRPVLWATLPRFVLRAWSDGVTAMKDGSSAEEPAEVSRRELYGDYVNYFLQPGAEVRPCCDPSVLKKTARYLRSEPEPAETFTVFPFYRAVRRDCASPGAHGKKHLTAFIKATELLETICVNLFLQPWKKEIKTLKVAFFCLSFFLTFFFFFFFFFSRSLSRSLVLSLSSFLLYFSLSFVFLQPLSGNFFYCPVWIWIKLIEKYSTRKQVFGIKRWRYT